MLKLDESYIISEYTTGRSSICIGKELNCSDATIRNRLKKNGIIIKDNVRPPKRKIEDLKNKKFGLLTVIKMSKTRKNNKVCWVCKCDCGNTHIVKAYCLKSGNTKSCGCLKRSGISNFRGFGYIGMTYWNNIVHGATVRNLKFDITIEYINELYIKQDKKCILTGLDLYLCSDKRKTASLDRIDSLKGYVKGNVQWVHKHINYMKQDLKEEYFIKMCELVFKESKK